jgi:hypothetical protein
VDLFNTKQIQPGGKLLLKDPTVIAFWREWEAQRRDMSKLTQELDIQDSGLMEEMAVLKAKHEVLESEKMKLAAQMKGLRGKLWLAITETEPAFDMSYEWALVREESSADTLCIMRDVDQNEMMRKAMIEALKGESSERKVGFGR